ncbi:hypothetical protein HELRODRAFT_78519, partial [Helobdella robusta]|uniref:Peptidase S1 domain-containing protein n=1 Tax=Helobdella robusta TaxID=6412 RepID=T1G3C5_HELRO
IINGDIAKNHAWPWQIQMYLSGDFQCGGSILNERWILTAAHCIWSEFLDIFEFKVTVGTNLLNDKGAKELSVVMVQGFNYSKTGFVNDIALLKLSEPLTFNKSVQPICLLNPTFAGVFDVCVATGHGVYETS